MSLHKLLCLTILFVVTKSETFEEFYSYVNASIAATTNYLTPTNNEKLYTTNTSTIKEFGTFDFIIVGGGSAGALLAARLSEISKWNILLLEAGDNQTKFTDIPGLGGYSVRSENNWGYYTAPQTTACLGMLNNSCKYPRGKILGGCAAINGVVYTRGIPSDFNDWVKLGNPGWSYNEVLPFFKKIEKVNFANADPYFYGHKGALNVNFTAPPSELAAVFINANIQNGLPEIDYNGPGIQGVSNIQYHNNGGKRDNSAHAFLDPAQNRPNLNVTLKAFVSRIIIKNRQTLGVEFVKDGMTYKATIRKEVILSAGAINSPQILLLSGIGPAKELSALGIKPLINLPAVGKHLKDQPAFVNLYFRTNRSSNNLSLEQNLQRYLAELTPFTRGSGTEQIAFMKIKKNSALRRDIELLTMPPPFSVPSSPKSAYNFKDLYTNIFGQYNTLTDLSIPVTLLKPKSEGKITLKSKSPLHFPVIDINLFSDPKNEDIETMYQGIQYTLSLSKTLAFKKVNATYISVQPECEHLKKNGNDRDYWYCAIRHSSIGAYHPVGTTRMGNSTKNSVVDTNLKVHKMAKLRVVDAGVMPDLISGHTNTPTYMIAEKISHQIKKEYCVV